MFATAPAIRAGTKSAFILRGGSGVVAVDVSDDLNGPRTIIRMDLASVFGTIEAQDLGDQFDEMLTVGLQRDF
jgi:hypothetical protein